MDKRLAEVFAFSEADLAANRNGNLSEKQLKEFRADTKETLAVYLIVLLLLPVPILINSYNFNFVLCGLVFTLMEAAAIIIYQHLRKQARFTLKAGDLRKVEGSLRMGIGYRGKRRYIYIEDEHFLVNKLQFASLHEGGNYTIYFTGNRIWSCEALLAKNS